MRYYSTNKTAPTASLKEAVVKGLAHDKGLYMPEQIKPLPQSFFDGIDKMSFQEIAYTVAEAFFGEDVPADDLRTIVYDTLSFDCPVVKVEDNISSRYRLGSSQRFPRCRRYPRLCPLSQRQGQSHPGMPVHDPGTKHHGH